MLYLEEFPGDIKRIRKLYFILASLYILLNVY